MRYALGLSLNLMLVVVVVICFPMAWIFERATNASIRLSEQGYDFTLPGTDA